MIIKMDAEGKDSVEIPEDKSAYVYGGAAFSLVAAVLFAALYFLV